EPGMLDQVCDALGEERVAAAGQYKEAHPEPE
ncbi:unnamed protein product, partial [marine sediment metagenome]